jgi:diacylglycerol kinase family enzyme
MERLGTGKGVAVLLNARAKRVTVRAVRRLSALLPDAQVLVSDDAGQARRHLARIEAARPRLLLSGGGDGTHAQLLNHLRERWCGPWPVLGLLPMGTGNGWASALGGRSLDGVLAALPKLARAPATTTFDLIEVEQTLCPFAGVGWDARVVNDYLQDLDRRSTQLLGSRWATRLHKSLAGYLYVLGRTTIPEEMKLLWQQGQALISVENVGPEAHVLTCGGELAQWAGLDGHDPSLLFHGPVSVAAAAVEPHLGFGVKAFPFARAKPGYFNLRVYQTPIVEAVTEIGKIWRGAPLRGAHDYFARKVKLRLSRPMPFQIAGDGEGLREEVELAVAKETVEVIDWRASLHRAA